MLRRIIIVAAVTLASATCEQSTAPVLTDRLTISGPAGVYLGGHGQFIATPLGANGVALPTRPIAWTSSDTTVLTITAQGLATGRALGSTSISAEADGKVATAPVTVLEVPVKSVDVQPRGIDSLYVGDSLQMTARTHDSIGGTLSGRVIVWTTSDTVKALVTANGLVHARAPGSFTVTASSEGKTGGAFLNAQMRAVTLEMPDSFTIPLRHVVRFIPNLLSESGTQLSGRLIAWSSSNPAILAVDPLGVLSPQQTGSATIYARNGALSDSSLVTVVPEPIASISLWWIAPVSVADTTVEAIRAIAYDAMSQYTTGAAPIWTSSDTTVARVAASPRDPWRALVTGVRAGLTHITAQSGTMSGAFDLTLTYPIARLVAVPDSVMLTLGEVRPLLVYGTDRFGNRMGISDYWSGTSTDTTVVAIATNAPVYVTGRKVGRTMVELRMRTLVDTVTVIVSPHGLGRLYWETDNAGTSNYLSGSMRLYAADSTGVWSSVPKHIQFTSTDTTVVAIPAPITMTGSQIVAFQSRKPGVATITAYGDSLFASLIVSVSPFIPTTVELDSAPRTLLAGDTVRLHLRVPGPEFPVTWSVTAAARARVSDSGTVTAIGPGDVGVIASTGAAADTAAFTILTTTQPTIARATPLPLIPGTTVTIVGSGFDPDPAADKVLIDSVPAAVTAATDSQLTLTLPAAGAWPCMPTHKARVLIQSAGQLGLDSLTLSVANQAPPMAPGDVMDLVGTTCTELPTGSGTPTYIVTAVNTDLNAPLSFAFRGAAAMTHPPPTASSEPVSSPVTGVSAPVPGFSVDSLRRAALFHRRLLEQSRALSLRAGAPAPLLRAARLAQPQRSVTATINNVAAIRIPKLEDPDFCSSYTTIQANLVYSGTHVLIFEDRMVPVAGTMANYYQALGQEFDKVMYPTLVENFGDPLAMDSLLDGDGKLAMVFSPVVNQYGAMGFVVSCDFYPESVAPSSNTGEIFYAQAPTAPGGGFGNYTADVWWWLIRSVVMHESKHLTAYAERLSRGAPIEDTWLEEGSAVLAEELWSRGVYGTQWKNEADYRTTIYCDVRPTWPECEGRPYSMFNAFAFLYDYARQHERRTPLGPTSDDDATFYGSGWSLIRWAIDQSNRTESEFLKELTQEASLTGVANLAARAQRPYDQVLSDWSNAMYYDSWDLAPPRPTWRMLSWRMSDIFLGMSNDFPNSFPERHPFEGRPWNFGGNFSFQIQTLPPGAWSAFVGTGNPWQLSTELLDFHSTTGGPVPAPLRIHIARSQ